MMCPCHANSFAMQFPTSPVGPVPIPPYLESVFKRFALIRFLRNRFIMLESFSIAIKLGFPTLIGLTTAVYIQLTILEGMPHRSPISAIVAIFHRSKLQWSHFGSFFCLCKLHLRRLYNTSPK